MKYQEYFDLVKEELKPYLEVYGLDNEGINAFMKREETLIKERFAMDLLALEDSKITIDQMKYGSVGSTAYCLSLLFE
ncbi:MAG: hypothetical protein IKB96_00940, partial [Prevotella sp.]|nr:hypothetical protein [Prevotella sp.]